MLYFEDLEEGQEFELDEETITREDIIAFADQWDPQPFHLGEDSVKPSVFDGIVASGLHTLCLGSRLMVEDILNDTSSMGGKGIRSIEFPRPVKPGDTLTGQLEIVEMIATSPERGDVTLELMLENQNDNPVMAAEYVSIFACRTDG
jgi:acyl dehydratase